MRKHVFIRLAALAVMLLVLQGAKCPQIPEMKTIELTAVSEQYVEFTFEARGTLNALNDEATAEISIDDLREDLEDADVDIEMVDTVLVHKILYGVTAYSEADTTRTIANGTLVVVREDTDEAATIFDDADEEVYSLLGELVAPPFTPEGIDFLNELMLDMLAAIKNPSFHGSFILTGTVTGQSLPLDRETNFDWRVRLYYQVAGRVEVERPEF
ncbi:MAG: hypothetical protein V1774_04545 [Candidatus Eisenbacteria bacterium]